MSMLSAMLVLAVLPCSVDLIEEALTIDENGCVAVPNRPGLGVTLDLEEAQRKFPFAL